MATASSWLEVRAHLTRHRHRLAVEAAHEYPDLPRVAGTPLLARWLPSAPVPSLSLRYEDFRSEPPLPPDPLLPPGRPSYSAAMAGLAAPTVFHDRPTYRLKESGSSLVFGPGSYFDGIDVGEACAHEYAARDLGRIDALPLRAWAGDPTARPANLAISTLTIRLGAEATCYLHWRDPAKVGHAGGMYQVLPVGVFQAAGPEPGHHGNDFSLWRSMIREFAEEMLGEPEYDGSDPVDYDGWPFARSLTAAARVSFVGMGVDPLTFATDLLAVVVIDAAEFDSLFGDLVSHNDEGRVLKGVPFDESTVERFVHHEPTQAAGAALLALAWQHRGTLLG